MQTLLFRDPRPLVERLGREFFLTLPESPGVYLMRDAADTVVYVGKAKNLRKRLSSYRVANPDRLKRRHLRLLREVRRIEIRDCRDEAAALASEAEFLRALKPKFNRAGTWPGKRRFLGWRCAGESIELTVFTAREDSNGARTPSSASSWNFFGLSSQELADEGVRAPLRGEDGWQSVGPLGSGALFLRAALARLIRLAMYPEHGLAGIPAGWAHGRFSEPTLVRCPEGTQEIHQLLSTLFSGQSEPFTDWLRTRIAPGSRPFELAVITADLEALDDFFQHGLEKSKSEA